MLGDMGFDPARSFWIANEWYWRITEGATTLTAESALRDFARPLLRLLGRDSGVALDGEQLIVTIGEHHTSIAVAKQVNDRIAINHLISDLNRALAATAIERAFAIAVPRRYELCGVVLELAELDRLYGDPQLLVPSTRRSWNG